MKEIIQKGMESAMDLRVPLKAEVVQGNDWFEAKIVCRNYLRYKQ